MPELADSHCHLVLEPLRSALPEVMRQAEAAGVRHIVCPGTTLESSLDAAALAAQWPQVRAAVGVHPHEAKDATPAVIEDLGRAARQPSVVAIGEVGLDYYYDHSPREQQRAVLLEFLGLARERGLPVILHCRDAYDDLLKLLHEAGTRHGVMHCASGPAGFILEALRMGLHVSFSGTVTFRQADDVRALVPLVPDDRLLVETDAPYLAPVPHRGKPNQPAWVAETARFVAGLRGVPWQQLAEQTTRNTLSLFRLRNSEAGGAAGASD